MKVSELVENSRTADEASRRIKVVKEDLPEDVELGDELEIDHEAVTAWVVDVDAFDVPKSWVVEIEIDLTEL